VKYRSKLDILAALLYAAQQETLKTHMTRTALVSSNQTEEYVGLLLDSGLVETHGNYYRTTEKGMRFLELYQEMEKAMFPKSIAARPLMQKPVVS
jgi:predicted transcriptional regulator